MVTMVVRRVALLIPMLLLLSFGVFLLSLGLRTDRAAEARAGGADATTEAIEEAKSLLHLDDPLLTRYRHWLSQAVQLDFGRSYTRLESVPTEDGPKLQGRSVMDTITTVAPRTASVVGVAVVFTLLIGLSVGVLGGTRPGSLADRVAFVFSTLGLAIPSFLVGMLLVTLLAINLGGLPAIGYVSVSEGGYWEWLRHLILPGIALSLAPAAVVARQMRAALVEVMGATYIRTAWAKGASRRRVVFGHALKNSLSAPLTVFGVLLTSLLSGTVVIESLFGIDGVGSMTINAVRSSDIPMLQGIVMVFILLTMLVNLAIDILYGVLDPKVRIT